MDVLAKTMTMLMLLFRNKSDRSTVLTLGRRHSEIAVENFDVPFFCSSLLGAILCPGTGWNSCPAGNSRLVTRTRKCHSSLRGNFLLWMNSPFSDTLWN